jgi:hypothetical protein
MMRAKTRDILIILILAYSAAQIIMPKIGLSLALNFDTSCSSGYFALLERVNTGTSSCGASDPDFVGFPFVVNFDYNTRSQKVISAILDLGLAVPLAGATLLLYKKKPWARVRNRLFP